MAVRKKQSIEGVTTSRGFGAALQNIFFKKNKKSVTILGLRTLRLGSWSKISIECNLTGD